MNLERRQYLNLYSCDHIIIIKHQVFFQLKLLTVLCVESSLITTFDEFDSLLTHNYKKKHTFK